MFNLFCVLINSCKSFLTNPRKPVRRYVAIHNPPRPTKTHTLYTFTEMPATRLSHNRKLSGTSILVLRILTDLALLFYCIRDFLKHFTIVTEDSLLMYLLTCLQILRKMVTLLLVL